MPVGCQDHFNVKFLIGTRVVWAPALFLSATDMARMSGAAAEETMTSSGQDPVVAVGSQGFG